MYTHTIYAHGHGHGGVIKPPGRSRGAGGRLLIDRRRVASLACRGVEPPPLWQYSGADILRETGPFMTNSAV